jgi:type IV pilus biogenesis protein PilP
MNKRFLIPFGMIVMFGIGAVAFAQDNGVSVTQAVKTEDNPVGVPILQPDLSVFEQLTDMQRKATLIEKDILLEGLKLKRKQLDSQAREMVEKEEDRQLERQQAKDKKEKDEAEARIKKERDALIKEAEEDLRLSELRAQQESLLRTIEEQNKKDEALKAAQAKAEQAKAEQDIVLAREDARRSVRGAQSGQDPLIVTTPSVQPPLGNSASLDLKSGGENFDSQLASLVGGNPTLTIGQNAAVEPEKPPAPPPNPVVKSVKGVGGQLIAKIILPDGGIVDVGEGDRIPGDWQVVKIDPDGVFAKKPKDKKSTRLSFGTKINLPVEAVVEGESKQPETGFSIPLASNNFPIPAGLPGTSAAAPRGLSGFR